MLDKPQIDHQDASVTQIMIAYYNATRTDTDIVKDKVIASHTTT